MASFGNPGYEDETGPGPRHRTPSDPDDVIEHVDAVYIPVTRKHNWTYHHVVVFMLTFFSYALFHSSRKSFSNVKSSISETWVPQDLDHPAIFDQKTWNSHDFYTNDDAVESFLGILDGCFLGAYAVGLFISGVLGDRFDPRKVISIGMILSAVTVLLFGFVTEVCQLYNRGFYICVWLVGGFVQSCGWPSEVCVMGNWFGRGKRGLLLGVWSACASIGNILGAYVSSTFLQYGYEYTFLVNASLLACGGVVVWFGLVSAPRELGLPDAQESDEEPTVIPSASTKRPEPIGIITAILLPGVIAYSLAYACLKLVNYSFFYWLPYYLKNNFHWDEALSDKLSTYYDWGGIAGGILGGVITCVYYVYHDYVGVATGLIQNLNETSMLSVTEPKDHMGCRSPVVIAMLLASMAALFGYSKSPNNKSINGVLMAVTGFFIGGPANLISAAVSADLGRNPDIKDNAEAVATVTGVLDGTGSIGAAIGQPLVALMDTHLGWNSVFYMFIVLALITALCLLGVLWRESKDLVERCRHKRGDTDSGITYQPLATTDTPTPS